MFYGVGCCVDQRPCGPSERRHKKTGILQNVNIRKISWTEHATKRRNAGNDWRKRVLIHTLRKRQRKWIAARNGYRIINERKKTRGRPRPFDDRWIWNSEQTVSYIQTCLRGRELEEETALHISWVHGLEQMAWERMCIGRYSPNQWLISLFPQQFRFLKH